MSLEFANFFNNLAGILAGLGNLPTTRDHYQRALAIYEAQLGPDHPKTVMVRERLARVQGELGSPSAAGDE